MSDKKSMPVIIGVGQMVQREKTVFQLDPLELMAKTCHLAAKDATLNDLPRPDTLFVVNCSTLAPDQPVKLLADKLGISPTRTGYTGIGASAPQWLVNRAADLIRHKKAETIIISGGEACYTHENTLELDKLIAEFATYDHSLFIDSVRPGNSELEDHYGFNMPTTIYSMFENAFRYNKGLSIKEHKQEIAAFCAELSQIASTAPYSWKQKSDSAAQIATLTSQNRMIAFPYTKMMCSNLFVNQSASLIMTSWAHAESLGVPKEKIIFIRGTGNANEKGWFFSERPALWENRSVAVAGKLALHQVSAGIDDIEFFNLYSCFPCAPRITAKMLGISDNDNRPLSIIGGMAYFGGAANNYTMHSICSMIDLLRENPSSLGLVHSLGWYMSKNSIGIYSATPGSDQIPNDDQVNKHQYTPLSLIEKANGPATVETYTIFFNSAGEPYEAPVIGRDSNGRRFLAKIKNSDNLLNNLIEEEIIGKQGTVKYDDTDKLNWFYI